MEKMIQEYTKAKPTKNGAPTITSLSTLFFSFPKQPINLRTLLQTTEDNPFYKGMLEKEPLNRRPCVEIVQNQKFESLL